MTIQLSHTAKSNKKTTIEKYTIESDFQLHKIEQEKGAEAELTSSVKKGTVQLAMCVKGRGVFWFSPHYSMPIEENQVMTLYNPAMELPHRLDVKEALEMVIISMSVSQLHQCFMKESEELHFLRGDKAMEKFYAKDEMHINLSSAVTQIFHTELSGQSQNLFMKGKAYELLSHYFNRPENADLYEVCPFLRDQGNVKKVKLAKEIILERMSEPPTIKKLSEEVGMSENQLKLGFKNIYGNTIYGYLNDFKMNKAKSMLDSGQFKVQDVAYELGYTNPSHFIAAFKKKFDITPKKYLMQS